MWRMRRSMNTNEFTIADCLLKILLNQQSAIKNQQSHACSCYLRSMTRAASFAGVILAAVDSSRMGRDKALLPWPPTPSAQAPSPTSLLYVALHHSTLPTSYFPIPHAIPF